MTVNHTGNPYKNKILTIPNVLSLVRIALIPVFVWAYCKMENGLLTGFLLALSGLTDSIDGFIARKLNMISDLGKILDPLADKLTQAAMLLCLVTQFPLMLIPFILLIIKETAVSITGLMVIRNTGVVYGAVWHGKVNTCLLYAVMILHVLWAGIPQPLSHGLILLCTGTMALSFLLYIMRNLRLIATGKGLHK